MKPAKEAALLTAALMVLGETLPADEAKRAPAQQPHDHRDVFVEPSGSQSILTISGASGRRTYAVINIKGAEPEVFWLAALRHPEFQKGKFMETSENLNEGQMRTELAKLGCSENEATFLIAKARAYPS
jgi:hypothetical protein